GVVHMWGAVIFELLHDIPGTFEQAQALRQLAAKEPVCAGFADLFNGIALMMQGNWKEGEAYLDNAAEFFKTVSLMEGLIWVKLYESKLLATQGQADKALLVIANAVAEGGQFLYLKSRALGLRARLLAERDADGLTVEAAYRAAVECARKQHAKY